MKLFDAQNINLPVEEFRLSGLEEFCESVERLNPFGLGYATYIETNITQTSCLFILVDGGKLEYSLNQSEVKEEDLCLWQKDQLDELMEGSGEDISVQ